ncbi:hypothetical protein, partial [Paraburkholderia tropica]|uniref:hypothetical protein n=1 Tax=Paraburkholderia tropica TaxID=92647 RepID=UPI001E4C6650
AELSEYVSPITGIKKPLLGAVFFIAAPKAPGALHAHATNHSSLAAIFGVVTTTSPFWAR